MKLLRLLAVFGLAASIGSVAIAAPTQATSLLREPSPAVSDQSWIDGVEITSKSGSANGISIDPSNYFNGTSITAFRGGVLYVGIGPDSATDLEPFFYDGSADAPVQLADISTGTFGSMGGQYDVFTVVGDKAFFGAKATGENDYFIYVTDGTADGTRRVLDFSTSFGGIVGVVDGKVLINAYSEDFGLGEELFATSDGGVIQLVKDFTNPGDSSISGYPGPNGVVYLTVNDGNATSYWVTDGSSAGTSEIDFTGFGYVELQKSAVCGSKFYFPAEGPSGPDNALRQELYSLDASQNHALVLEAALASGTTNYNGGSRPLPVGCLDNETLVFLAQGDEGNSATDEGMKIYAHSDEGTTLLWDLGEYSYNYAADRYSDVITLNGKLYFNLLTGGNPTYGEIWYTDGTPAGTSALIPRSSSNLNQPSEQSGKPADIRSLVAAGNRFYMTGRMHTDGSLTGFPTRRGVFVSDGTLDGTTLFSYAPIPESSWPYYDTKTMFAEISDGTVYYQATTIDGGAELFQASVPVLAPGAPAITGITVGDGQVSVAFTAPSSDGGAAITNYEVSTDGGSTFNALSPASTTSPIVVSGLTNGQTYTIQLKAVNSVGPGAASNGMSGLPKAPEPSELDLPTVSATMTNGVISVAFTGLTQSDIESLYVKVMPTSAAFNSAAEDSYGTVGFVAGTVLPNTSALPAVANGTLTVTISQMLSLSESDGEEVITPVDIDPAGSYHLSYNISGATSSEYPNGWQIDYYGPLYNGDVQPIGVTLAAESGSDSSSGSGSSSDSGSSSSTTVPAETSSDSPSLVTSANQELLTASLGSAKIVINGELVAVDLVQAPEGLRRSYGPARTFAEVQALQDLADQMIAAVQDVIGTDATLPISVTKTDTGATISGLVTDPVSGESLAVPVEDVLLILNESLAIMVGGADGEGDPANIAFDGVLEFGEGGYVAVLAYGLTPGAAGEIVVMSTPELIDTFAVDADGGVLTQAQIPSDLAAGEHTVVVAVDGQSASLGFRVLPQGTLPVTGSDSSTTAVLLVLVAVGSLIVLLASRRRKHQA